MSKQTKERESAATLDALYASDEFRMYCFKVLSCSKHYSHDWTVCPFAHPGEKARRRDPRVFRYAGVECPHVKEGLKCPRGDLCPFAHNIFECWLHPTRYRTQLCNEPASCRRKVCFFAHTLEELREPTNPLEHIAQDGQNSANAAAAAAAAAAASSVSSGSRHSLDSTSSSFSFVRAANNAPMRHSFDISVPQQRSSPETPAVVSAAQQPFPAALHDLNQATGANWKMNDLASALQQLTVSVGSNQSLQNDRIVKLLLLLLGEVANQASGQGDGSAMNSAAAALAALPRLSLDNHVVSRTPDYGTQYGNRNGFHWPGERGSGLSSQPIPEHVPLKSAGGRLSVDSYSPYNIVGHHRGPSIDPVGASAVSEAMASRLNGVGRVSLDGALLTAHTSEASAMKRMSPTGGHGVHSSCQQALVEGYRNSSDSMESDETLETGRDSGDGAIPDFILH